MKTVLEHLDTVRAQPHGVKKGVALMAAAVCAGLVAVLWLGVSFATGAFAIAGNNFADATGQETPSPAPAAGVEDAGLAGAAASLSGQSSQPAAIEIIDASTSTAPASDPTVISF